MRSRPAPSLLLLLLALTPARSPADNGGSAPLGRWTAHGYADASAVLPANRNTAAQNPAGLLDLNLSGDMRPRLRLFADVHNLWGGPVKDGDGFGFINLRDTFQNTSPTLELEEAYADLFLGDLDVRIGKQKVAWGRLDLFQPTDVINPRRFSDPFLLDENDAKVGVPALRATYFPHFTSAVLSDPGVSLVWVPLPVPFRFPMPDERWFPAAAGVPAELDISPDLFGLGLDAQIHNTLYTRNDPPAWQLDEGALGMRISGLSAAADWSLIFYHGPETAPALHLATTVHAPQAQAKVRAGRSAILADLQQLEGTAVLTPQHGRIELVGADMALTAGALTLRAEAAYGRSRLVARSSADLLSPDNLRGAVCGDSACSGVAPLLTDLLAGRQVPVRLGNLFERRDTIDWGLGIDYPYRGWMPVLQLNQTAILDNRADLLVSNLDTRLLLALRRSFLDERLRTELVAFQGMPRSYSSAMLRLTYAITDNLRLRIGYLLLAGSNHTLVGQYQNNDEVFAQLRYSH